MKLTADTITPHGNVRHGQSRSVATGRASPTYRTWVSMLARCNNPKASNYHLYGGRGIRVVDRWHKFETFLAEMGERPDGTTLDRIDTQGPYAAWNCRWATASEQARNRRPTAQWSERPGGANRRKTLCKRGHSLTADNVRFNGTRRVCRECAAMHDRNRKANARGGK